MTCGKCGKELTRDEQGISRKLINRAAKVCYCMDCLAEMYKCSVKSLEDLIERYRETGCTLFK